MNDHQFGCSSSHRTAFTVDLPVGSTMDHVIKYIQLKNRARVRDNPGSDPHKLMPEMPYPLLHDIENGPHYPHTYRFSNPLLTPGGEKSALIAANKIEGGENKWHCAISTCKGGDEIKDYIVKAVNRFADKLDMHKLMIVASGIGY